MLKLKANFQVYILWDNLKEVLTARVTAQFPDYMIDLNSIFHMNK